MKNKSNFWKKGSGKLGVLQPLIGTWEAKSISPMGKLTCTRTFSKILGNKYIELYTKWDFGGKVYEEKAVFGIIDNKISFWSFTSDGKNSQGTITDGTDVHPDAICFEAQMPAGIARMIYWPNEESGFNWAVESKTKKGWNRFTNHHYIAIDTKKVE